MAMAMVCAIPDVAPPEHDVGPGPHTGVTPRLPPPPHRAETEPGVQGVVIHLLVLVQERVVHRQLLLVIKEAAGDIGRPL